MFFRSKHTEWTAFFIEIGHFLAGCIGVNTAGAFRAWCEIFRNIPPMEDVFGGSCETVPDRPELLYATAAAMVDYARKGVSEKALANSVEYACRLPIEFRFRIFTDYYHIRAVRLPLLGNKTYSQWVSFHEEAGEL